MKRWLCSVLAGGLMFFGLAGYASSAEQLFLLDWIIYGKHAPFFASRDFGFFKREGLDVRLERGFGSGDTAKRVGTKTALFGMADTGSVIAVRVRGAKVIEVAMIHAKSPYAAYFPKTKAVTNPKQMKGYKIGSPPGNAAKLQFPVFANMGGLDPKEVVWVDMTYGAMLPSLLSGRVDAIVGYTTEGVTWKHKARVAGVPITELRYSTVGFEIYSNGLVVHEDTIQENPDLVRRFVKANMEAWAHCLLYTRKCLDNFYKYAPGMSKKLVDGHYVEAINILIDEGVKQHGLGWIDFKKMDYTVDIVTKYTPLAKRIPTKELFTNEFLPQVGKEHKPEVGKM